MTLDGIEDLVLQQAQEYEERTRSVADASGRLNRAYVIAADVLARVVGDRGAAFESDAVAALVTLRSDDTAAWVRAREWLRAAHVPLRELDAALARQIGAMGDGGAPESGRALQLPDPEPCRDPVDGGALLEALVTELIRYIVLPAHTAAAIALWVLAAWTLAAHTCFPKLALTSPEKRCGKTRLLELLSGLVPRPLAVSNITPAALFRSVERWKPTLLVDEADTFLVRSDDLRGIINSGHTRATAFVIRCAGDEQEPRRYSTWCPQVIACIGRLPDTIEDRALLVRLRRRAPGEQVARLRHDGLSALADLPRRCARWAADHLEALEEADPPIPDGLNDRTADNWRPLLAVAALAGGSWPERARTAAVAISGPAGESDSQRTVLLADLAAALQAAGGRIASAALVERLAAMEDRPWPEWRRGRPITPRQVAALLRPYGIVPRTIRLEEGMTAKGYLAEDDAFTDAVARYLPALAVTTSQASPSAPHSNGAIRHTNELLRIVLPHNSAPNGSCDGVTARDAAENGPGDESASGTTSRCYVCRSERWWRRVDQLGPWTCGTCHPWHGTPELVEWRGAEVIVQ